MKVTKFIQIAKDLIKIGDSYSFKIYQQLEDKSFMIMFDAKVTVSTNYNKVSTLYIKEEDEELYQDFVRKFAKKFLNDPKADEDKKIALINEIANTTITSLFEKKLTTQSVKDAAMVVGYVVDLTTSSEDAIFNMLKDLSVEYDTYRHCVDVAYYAVGFGQFLKLPKGELEILGKAAILHNIGMREINPEIINKVGKLEPDEIKEIQKHPQIGTRILRQMGVTDKTLLSIVEQHHEKCDGSGYPKRLREHEIHELAKILTICDVFAAMTTQKEYRNRESTYDAIGVMLGPMQHTLSLKHLKAFTKFMSTKE